MPAPIVASLNMFSLTSVQETVVLTLWKLLHCTQIPQLLVLDDPQKRVCRFTFLHACVFILNPLL